MIGARALQRGCDSRALLGAVGLAAGVGLVALLTVVGVLGVGGPTEDDVRQAYQDGFDSGLGAGDTADNTADNTDDATADTAEAETSSDLRAGVRLVPLARGGQLVEVSEACFLRPISGCPEIY